MEAHSSRTLDCPLHNIRRTDDVVETAAGYCGMAHSAFLMAIQRIEHLKRCLGATDSLILMMLNAGRIDDGKTS